MIINSARTLIGVLVFGTRTFLELIGDENGDEVLTVDSSPCIACRISTFVVKAFSREVWISDSSGSIGSEGMLNF
jgi:hypothetical protein